MLRDKTNNDKLIYIPYYKKQNYPFEIKIIGCKGWTLLVKPTDQDLIKVTQVNE